jgi:protein-arginine kinase activator protein McsA
MDDREKLIELFMTIPNYMIVVGRSEGRKRVSMHHIADYLIANNVVVLEKGEWEFQDDGCELLRCSVCGYEYCDLIECKNFCGNCGADMR